MHRVWNTKQVAQLPQTVRELASFSTFAVGAFVPLLPFVIASGNTATVAAIVAGGATLFLVGSLMSILTAKNPVRSGLRMLLIGAAAAAITFGVGKLLHVGGAVG